MLFMAEERLTDSGARCLVAIPAPERLETPVVTPPPDSSEILSLMAAPSGRYYHTAPAGWTCPSDRYESRHE